MILSRMGWQTGEQRAGEAPHTSYESMALVARRCSSWTLQRLVGSIAEQTGIRVQDETVRMHLKAAEIVLSRPQHTISSVNDHMGEIVVLVKRHKRRREIAELLQALVDKHPTGTIYVAWDKANTHEDDKVEDVRTRGSLALGLALLTDLESVAEPYEDAVAPFK